MVLILSMNNNTVSESTSTPSILNHLEGLLLLAKSRGISVRRPNSAYTEQDRIKERESIDYHMTQLDKLSCSWEVQNNALNYINNAEDQVLYESLYKAPLRQIAGRLLKG